MTKGFIPEGERPKLIQWFGSVRQNGEMSTEQQIANMKLITAAPELLEALICMVKWAGMTVKPQLGEESLPKCFEKAQDIILKSQGI